MLSTIMPVTFQFEALTVQVVDRAGEPWFIAADVCAALGLQGNASQHTRRLPDSERGMISNHTPSGHQDMVIINEPGLYRLTFASRLEKAERFKNWIFREVLPAIRKTGSYAATPAFVPAPAPAPETITILKDEYIDLLRFKAHHPESKPAKPRRPVVPLTEPEIAEMRRLKRLGLTVKEIARRLNRSNATVSLMTRETAHV